MSLKIFEKASIKRLKTNILEASSFNYTENDKSQKRKEFRFVKCFEVLKACRVKMDKNARTIRCVQMKWHRTTSDPGNQSPGKSYGLVPIFSVRGAINLVPKNEMLAVIDKIQSRAGSHF